MIWIKRWYFNALPVPRTILEFSLAFSSGEKSTAVYQATSPGDCLYVPATLPTYKQQHLFSAICVSYDILLF